MVLEPLMRYRQIMSIQFLILELLQPAAMTPTPMLLQKAPPQTMYSTLQYASLYLQ